MASNMFGDTLKIAQSNTVQKADLGVIKKQSLKQLCNVMILWTSSAVYSVTFQPSSLPCTFDSVPTYNMALRSQ